MRYEVIGGSFPAAVCKLNKGEMMFTESGGMSWMSEAMQYKTDTRGGVMKGLGRMFSGESLFMTTYMAAADNQEIAFGSSFPGKIVPIHLEQGQSMIVQKRSFLAAESTVTVEAFFRKKLGAGFFGGEGFILQRISGPGVCFLEFDGDIVEKNLQPGEVLQVDQGYIGMYDPSVQFDIVTVKGVKNILFSGEGLFLGKLTGPGRVFLQTMPMSTLANEIIAMMPSSN